VGASEIVTLAGGVRRGPRQGDLARLIAEEADPASSPVVAVWEGRIAAVGERAAVEAELEADGLPLARFARIDAAGGSVTPGLIDPHTHLLFAGSREDELVLRQEGASYLDILAAGGGILSTVAATRAAIRGGPATHGRRWLDEMLTHGVTTVEAKSGYGLDLETELRLVGGGVSARPGGPIDVVATWLGAHCRPCRVPFAA
jgi:imidazolonepropionase